MAVILACRARATYRRHLDIQSDLMECDDVERRQLWTGVGAAVVLAAGVATWAVMSEAATSSDVKTTLSAHALLQAGLVQANEKDLDGAEDTFTRVLTIEPDNKLAWYNLGVVSQQSGRPADALKAYDAVLKIDPKFTSAIFNQAMLLKTTNPDRAITLLKRAISLNPKAAKAYFQLGEALAKRGNGTGARDAYRHAILIDQSLFSQVPKPFRDADMSVLHPASPSR
ncbi:tetratricopeptide repeat protein [Streptomyces sp. NPDC005533]|uniref:tetratricopeptide repeat protein n=1 Tax=Streptomyces sp. NPDC005533 TaxID=3364723 RepID=UPI003690FB6E